MALRLSDEEANVLLKRYQESDPTVSELKYDSILDTEVFIAGSGPIGCAYARTILDSRPSTEVHMAEIGSQDHPIIGAHHKNSIKYQKDFDAFVNVIKGALQPVSIPPGDTFQSTLAKASWAPTVNPLVIHGNNPLQSRETNLPATAVTRTVGGMATHWTCSCPEPQEEERKELNKVIPQDELKKLLDRSGELLGVHPDQFDHSIRHSVVKKILQDTLKNRGVTNIPLAVKRRSDNSDYVTWSGSNTVLGEQVGKIKLHTETRVTRLLFNPLTRKIDGAIVRDLNRNKNILVRAKIFVIACGAIGTPQILWNSTISPPGALGCYLSEQSMAFCQIVLKREIVESIANTENPDWQKRIAEHKEKYPKDPLPIPFNDPEPQVMIPYHADHPWHVQVHRDAFSYGDVGPRADPRLVVDLRFFGKSEIVKANKVTFPPKFAPTKAWEPGVTDTYGMPQATFEVTRTNADGDRDQRMMKDMTEVANVLGGFLPGSYPQFMEPGLALHITGTTRIGNDPENSVANAESRVHGIDNLWVGGNGCIPDATASNPTRTSVALAIKGANSVVTCLNLPTGAYTISNIAHNQTIGHPLTEPTKLPIIISGPQIWNVEYLRNGLYLVTLNKYATFAENNHVWSLLGGHGSEWIIKQRAHGVNEYTIISKEDHKGWTLKDKDDTQVSLEVISATKSIPPQIFPKHLWSFSPATSST